ncbi:MAG TPA: Smr/MutS family protein [Vicinamibacterales bacterium]|nr:Smr/MutS family protein [Vicinamibacterales bacterium]
MQPGALRALEWDQIVAVVRGYALTPTGAVRLAELAPQSDPHRAAQLLAATAEGVKYLDANPAFSLHAPDDLEAVLSALAVEGRALDPLRLLAFAEFLDSIALTCAAIRRVGGNFPTLKALAENCGSFKNQIADVRTKIDPSGEVNDNASPELSRVRTQLRKQRSRLRSTLESYLRGKDTSRYLQDQVVSERDGRYVLVVKAEHRASIPGIIHGSSGSGASLYLEPLSTVEINNEIVAIEQQEREEVHRILRHLTDAFRTKPIELRQAVDAATELDVIQAKVRFAQLISGVAPVLSTDGRLELRAARHPLLIPGVIARQLAEDETRRERGEAPAKEPVPVDVLVIPPTTVLLITGPNTGGKTVALKTAGLLALMAQAGLFVPAADARLPVFRSFFADIGDEQSIAANLSTFSWHITNIASMDRSLAMPALVLLDELGAGTDPLEGGALGVAIIEHFRTRGALVISTTHYDALKTYAATTPGVTAAAFGFTPDTYEPTYQMLYGSPGRSLALEMAGRLGLNPVIVDNARKNLSQREAQLAEHLAKIDADLRALEHERRLVKREREALGEADSRARVREDALRQREETFKLRLNEKLDERMRDARVEIDAIVADLKKQAAALAEHAARNVVAPSTGDTGRLRGDARAAVDALVDKYRSDPAAPAPAADAVPARSVAVGDRVVLGPLGLEGVVVNVHDREAEVEVRGKRFRAHTHELRVLGGTAPKPAPVRVNVQLQPRDGGSSSELLLVGNTVDQALDRLEKFLDETVMSEQRAVRLIHGFGTGRLKEAVVDYLHKHPLVAHVRAASPQEGGGGVTIAELKD